MVGNQRVVPYARALFTAICETSIKNAILSEETKTRTRETNHPLIIIKSANYSTTTFPIGLIYIKAMPVNPWNPPPC